VMYSGGVGGGQETVTYAAPPVQDGVTYFAGGGYGMQIGVAGGQETVTYAAPQAYGVPSPAGGSVARPVHYTSGGVTYAAAPGVRKVSAGTKTETTARLKNSRKNSAAEKQ